MALETGIEAPSLEELTQRIRADLHQELPGEGALVRGTALWVLATVLAAAFRALYLLLEWVARQMFPDTATTFLARHASIWSVDRNLGTRATGEARFTGTPSTAIPEGTRFYREADQWHYQTTAAGVMGGSGYVDIPVESTEVGESGNYGAADGFRLEGTISGVDAEVTIRPDHADYLTGGKDAEDQESHRGRVLDRIRNPEGPGTEEDYVGWVRDALPEVAEVFVDPVSLGEGTVLVQFIMEPDAGDPSSIFPDSGQVDTVDAAVQLKRPITAHVTVDGPTPWVVTMDVSIRPNTTEVQDQVEAELVAMFNRSGRPGGTIDNSTIRGAITASALEDAHRLTDLNGDGTGLGDLTVPAGSFPQLGTINWSTLP